MFVFGLTIVMVLFMIIGMIIDCNSPESLLKLSKEEIEEGWDKL